MLHINLRVCVSGADILVTSNGKSGKLLAYS